MTQIIENISFHISDRWHVAKEKMVMNFIWWLPKWVIYWAIIRAWANATSGEYGNTNPAGLSVDEMIKRWEKK